MKKTPFLFSLLAVAAATLTSCQNDEPVKNAAEDLGKIDLSNAESFRVAIDVPGDMRTRAQEPGLSYGTDGLFNFSRDIDRLWYAVYKNGTLLYHSEQDGIPQAEYDADQDGFYLDIQIPRINGDIKPEDYSVFFFAGNSADKVSMSEITDGIGLDFANKTMYAYPAVLNKTTASGNMYNPQQYDYFAKYLTLDKVVGNNTKGSVTLTRPFAQVSLLTDELCQASVLKTYSSTGSVSVTTVPSVFTQEGMTTANTLPYGWNYDSDEILVKDASALNLSLSARAHDNSLNAYTIPQEVTFKDRKMFCVASYLMLAPDAKKPYAVGATKQQFNFDLDVQGDVNSTDATASADIPAAGLKANEKYVLYNKKYDPSTGEGGSGGILSTHYALDIVVDPAWEGTNETGF